MDYKQFFSNNWRTAGHITRAVAYFRKQDYESGMRVFQTILEALQETVEIVFNENEQLQKAGITVDKQYIMKMLSDIMKAQEEKDYILWADLLELTLLPFFISLQDMIRQVSNEALYDNYFDINIKVLAAKDAELACLLQSVYTNLQKREDTREYTASNGVIYQVEDTQTGYPTLKITRKDKSYYLHSNANPFAEGEIFTDTYWNQDVERMNICGAGLLYHVFSISDNSLYAFPIHVYEPDSNVLVIALTIFDVTEYIQKNCIYLHIDESMKKFSKAVTNPLWGMAIHYSSLQNIDNLEVKNSMEKFFITVHKSRDQRQLLTVNFKSNVKNLQDKTKQVGTVDMILTDFAEKDIYIIAAGPSLDKNIDLLKKCPENSILLATGTVFNKMMQMGIRPDYVIISDPNDRVIWQIGKQERENVPMLLLSTASRFFIGNYHGPKYLIFQKDFPKAEELAEQMNYTLFETGGSVSTTALDVAIRGNAARIIFLGLDLAFTNDLAHADSTSARKVVDKEELIPVKAYGGGTVLTDHRFLVYKDWIERRVKEAENGRTEMINATEGGAYIQGMRHLPLEEVIRNS